MVRIAVVIALLGAACYGPSFQEGRPCSATGECPSGQTCSAADNKCYADGVAASDASVMLADADPNAPDADPNAPDASIRPDADVAPDARIVIDASAGPCDPVADTGCPAGQMCTAVDDGGGSFTTKCATAGTLARGASCAPPSVCAGGLYCISGICEAVCTTAPDSCMGSQTCVVFAGLFADRTGVGVCQPTCDPFQGGAGCTSPDACYLSNSNVGLCATEGTVGENGICMFVNGCQSGFGCIVPESQSNPTTLTCQRYCDGTVPLGQCGGGNNRCAKLNQNFTSRAGVPDYMGICVHCGMHPQLPECGGSQPYP